jgi:hypothetical protein
MKKRGLIKVKTAVLQYGLDGLFFKIDLHRFKISGNGNIGFLPVALFRALVPRLVQFEDLNGPDPGSGRLAASERVHACSQDNILTDPARDGSSQLIFCKAAAN